MTWTESYLVGMVIAFVVANLTATWDPSASEAEKKKNVYVVLVGSLVGAIIWPLVIVLSVGLLLRIPGVAIQAAWAHRRRQRDKEKAAQ